MSQEQVSSRSKVRPPDTKQKQNKSFRPSWWKLLFEQEVITLAHNSSIDDQHTLALPTSGSPLLMTFSPLCKNVCLWVLVFEISMKITESIHHLLAQHRFELILWLSRAANCKLVIQWGFVLTAKCNELRDCHKLKCPIA